MQVTVSADTTKFTNSMSRAAGRLSSFGNVARRVAHGVAVAAGAMLFAFGRFAIDAIKDASSLEQSLGGVESVYKKFSGQMVAQSEMAAEKVGLSMESYQRLGVMTGTLLKNAGIPMKKLATQTDVLVTLAADLAATFGGSVEEAATAMNSALRGEFEPIRKFGIALSIAQIQEQALLMTHKSSSAELTKREKILATQALLLEQGADASGQFARESETLAQRQQVLQAKWDNLSATLGEDLLPIAEALSKALIAVVDNPKFKAGLDRMVQNFEDFGVWLSSPEGIKKVDEFADSLVAVADALISVTGFVKELSQFSPAGWLVDMFSNGKTKNGYVIPFGNPGPPAGPRPPREPRPDRGGNNRGEAPIINFNTPIDPVSAGRELTRVLNAYDRSNGGRR